MFVMDFPCSCLEQLVTFLFLSFITKKNFFYPSGNDGNLKGFKPMSQETHDGSATRVFKRCLNLPASTTSTFYSLLN